jgi:hypothetical protein
MLLEYRGANAPDRQNLRETGLIEEALFEG